MQFHVFNYGLGIQNLGEYFFAGHIGCIYDDLGVK
jgi:hypothetical protein